jgi:hypothetical protein
MTEAQLQQSIIIWFRNNYQMHGKGLIFSVANESTYKNKTFKNTGTMPGVSDLIVVLNGKTIFIELKTETGIQSEKQKEFETKVKQLNQEYYLIRSLETFKNEIERQSTTI